MEKSDVQILVVDDEKDLAEVVVDSFEMEDFKVCSCHSAEDAVEIYKTQGPFQVIISDAHMPGKGGLDLLMDLKIIEKNKFPLFYLCTGDVDIKEETLIEKGGQAVIAKPYNLFATH